MEMQQANEEPDPDPTWGRPIQYRAAEQRFRQAEGVFVGVHEPVRRMRLAGFFVGPVKG
jgi:hypothetical protein